MPIIRDVNPGLWAGVCVLGVTLSNACLADPASFVWTNGNARFGGLSAIEVTNDGAGLVALTDRGKWITATIARDRHDQIIAIEQAIIGDLLGPDGTQLGPGQSDTEGLAIGPDGRFWVSFEGPARVLVYTDLKTPGQVVIDSPDFAELAINSALEGIAVGPDQSLYTLPERFGGPKQPFPVWRFNQDRWDTAFHIPRDDAFVPVGADVGPDGRLYILERDVLGLWFRSRLLRVNLDGTGQTVVFQSGFGTHDNLEGVAIWQSASGLHATMISDDNFLSLQHTELVEVKLPD